MTCGTSKGLASDDPRLSHVADDGSVERRLSFIYLGFASSGGARQAVLRPSLTGATECERSPGHHSVDAYCARGFSRRDVRGCPNSPVAGCKGSPPRVSAPRQDAARRPNFRTCWARARCQGELAPHHRTYRPRKLVLVFLLRRTRSRHQTASRAMSG